MRQVSGLAACAIYVMLPVCRNMRNRKGSLALVQATHLPESQHAPNLPCIDAKVTLNSLHQEEETEQGGSAVLARVGKHRRSLLVTH